MLRKSCLIAVALGAFAVASGASAQAQTVRVENGARFGSWTVSCEAVAVNETLCVLSQRLVRSDTGAALAELIAFNADDGPGAWLVARVPNGVFFPAGFVMAQQDSDTQFDLEWQACSPDMCEALIALDGDILDQMVSGEDWAAGYRPDIASDSVVFRIGLDGLETGLAALAEVLGQPGPRGSADNGDAPE